MKLEVKKLTKIYHSDEEGSLALNDITISFPDTGFVVITGESGSGKTTLLNVLSGFVGYEEGDFFVDGVDFLSYSDEDLELYRKNDIGFVFQDYHLIEDHTVIDNLIESLLIIGMRYEEAKKKSIDFLKLVNLEEKKNVKVRNLSGGQKQKIAILRALIKEPKVVLCDEPTANLDVESGKAVFELLKKYSKNNLVIVTTHNYEDAKDYVTELIRIYHGKLTVHEVINENNNTGIQKDNKSPRSVPLSLLNVKNHIPKGIMKFTFFGVFIAVFILVLTLFSANIDETSTKIFSKDIFNNINQNEMLVMHKDGSSMSEQELKDLLSVPHIINYQEYGLATEMNYYYRENIDYQYDVVIKLRPIGTGEYEEYTEELFTPIHHDLYIREYTSFIDNDDLIEGVLPQSYFDVVANSNYHVGDQITAYLRDPLIQGDHYLEMTFNVSGIFSKNDHNLYFSEEFMLSMDYLQHPVNESTFKFIVTVLRPRLGYTSNFTFALLPLYNPSLASNEVRLSSDLIESYAYTFNPDNVITESHVVSSITSKSLSTSFNREDADPNLKVKYLYAGKDVIDLALEGYTPYTSRIFIDDYSYMNDVIGYLTANNYDTLSPYRAGSTEYDTNKQIQRAIILISSIVVIALLSIIYFIFGYLFEKSNTNTDKTLYLLGASRNSLKKASTLSMSITYVLSIGFGIGLYFLLSRTIQFDFIKNINLYLRFYHFFIVMGLTLFLNLLIWLRYVRQISLFRRGGNN